MMSCMRGLRRTMSCKTRTFRYLVERHCHHSSRYPIAQNMPRLRKCRRWTSTSTFATPRHLRPRAWSPTHPQTNLYLSRADTHIHPCRVHEFCRILPCERTMTLKWLCVVITYVRVFCIWEVHDQVHHVCIMSQIAIMDKCKWMKNAWSLYFSI